MTGYDRHFIVAQFGNYLLQSAHIVHGKSLLEASWNELKDSPVLDGQQTIHNYCLFKVGFVLGKVYYGENSFERAFQHFTKLAHRINQELASSQDKDLCLKFLIKCNENAAQTLVCSTNHTEATKIMKRAEALYQQMTQTTDTKILQCKSILKRAVLQKKSSSYLEAVATLEQL